MLETERKVEVGGRKDAGKKLVRMLLQSGGTWCLNLGCCHKNRENDVVEIYLEAKSIKNSDRGLWSREGWAENK